MCHASQSGVDPGAAAARRELRWRWDHDGTLVLRARFTAEQGAQLLAALTELTKLSADAPARSAEHHEQPEPEPIAARRADALVSLVTGGGNPATQVVVILTTDTTEVAVQTESVTAHIQGGPAIPLRVAERIICTARVRALLRDRQGNPLYLGRSRRLTSRTQLSALHVRDHGTCQFPGCDHNRHLDAHHVVHWLRGGRTDIDNLVLICEHHHRLIHDHGYRVRGRGTSSHSTVPTADSSTPLAPPPTEATINSSPDTPTRRSPTRRSPPPGPVSHST